MAVVARQRRDERLARLAVEQLRLRRDRLIIEQDIYQSISPDGTRTGRNWARGVAWYALGLTRTLAVLGREGGVEDLRTEARRVAKWAMRHQQPNGLWTCFLDEPETGAETSGSAGIAAALAIGAGSGLLPADARAAAVKAFAALHGHLTPDGFLAGVAQANKGGEALQRGGYRVILQAGMGLMAQLAAAL